MTHQTTAVVDVLRKNGVILTPTDTVWGLSADARSVEAHQKLIEIKGRGQEKGMIILVHTEVWLERCVQHVPDVAWDLMEVQSKPTTIVYQNASSLISHVTPPDNSIGIRLVKNGPIFDILKKWNAPLLSSSANISGQPTPKHFNDISEELKNKVDLVYKPLDFEDLNAQPSAVIKLDDDGTIKILRK